MSSRRTDIDDSDICTMKEVYGWTYQEIADYYGVGISTIYFRLHPEKQKESNKQWRLENPEKKKENNEQYYQEHSEEIKEQKKEWRLENPEYGKEYYQDNREEIKETTKQWQLEHPEYNKEYSKEWWQTDKGKACKQKENCNRRGLGTISLNKPFPGSEFHHIDEEHGIHIPGELHRSIYHNLKTGQGMEDINAIAFNYITEDTFDKLIAGDI